jgi:hypothetical protein
MLKFILFVALMDAAAVATAFGVIVVGGGWWAPVVMVIVPSLVGVAFAYRRELAEDLGFWWRYQRPGHRSTDLVG